VSHLLIRTHLVYPGTILALRHWKAQSKAWVDAELKDFLDPCQIRRERCASITPQNVLATLSELLHGPPAWLINHMLMMPHENCKKLKGLRPSPFRTSDED
jgi:hypothetical protein